MQEFTELNEKIKSGETTAEEDSRYAQLAPLMAEKQVEGFHSSPKDNQLIWQEQMGAEEFKTAQSYTEAASKTHYLVEHLWSCQNLRQKSQSYQAFLCRIPNIKPKNQLYQLVVKEIDAGSGLQTVF